MNFGRINSVWRCVCRSGGANADYLALGILIAFLLSGCTTTQRWVAAGVIVTSIALSQDSDKPQVAEQCYAIVPPGIIEQRLC